MRNSVPAAAFLAWVLACVPAAAQSGNFTSSGGSIPGKHRGAVTAVVRDAKGQILSAGEDGFLEIWNGRAAEDRFQISPYGIVSLVLRPGTTQAAAVESDGLGLYRISAWDYAAKKNLFTLHFRDSISYINYSAAGGFLIVARSGRTGAVFIHPETGELLESPEELSGSIAFAATGRTERTMIVYLSSGILSYWDIETGSEIRRFEVPSNIRSPVLFGNNRFLGGFDSRGLLVIDAVTGLVLARDEYLTEGTIFSGSPDSAQFSCLAFSDDMPVIYRMEINLSGRLTTVNRRNVPVTAEVRCCVSGDGDTVIIGSAQGTLWLLDRSGGQVLETGNPVRIIDAASSSQTIAFISENNRLAYIPLDYSRLKQNDTLPSEDAGNYTGIVSDSSGSGASSQNAESRFLLWRNSHAAPLIKTFPENPAEASGGGFILDKLNLRFPLRTALVMGGNALFLDTSGAAAILNMESGDIRFSYSAAGAVDAAFINEDTLIFGRSAVSGNTPFVTVNISTGETVPLAYPALAGVRVYRGGSGAIYGAAVAQSGGTVQTSIIRLNTSSPARSEKLVEYSGEDSYFSLAESGGNLASTLGTGEATLYRAPGRNQYIAREMASLERSQGLPVKVIEAGRRFIVIDEEGGISWHDNWTGKLLAVLRLYGDHWELKTGEGVISGDQ